MASWETREELSGRLERMRDEVARARPAMPNRVRARTRCSILSREDFQPSGVPLGEDLRDRITLCRRDFGRLGITRIGRASGQKPGVEHQLTALAGLACCSFRRCTASHALIELEPEDGLRGRTTGGARAPQARA